MRPHCVRNMGGAVLVLVAGAAVAAAQSLGDLAAKEQERREKERQKRGGSSKVITENDLRGGGRGTLSSAGSTEVTPAASPAPAEGAAASPAASPAPAEKSPDEVRAEQESGWRQRLQQARDEVSRLTAEVDGLQQGLNDLSQPLYGSVRTAAINDLEARKAALETARQKVADLEEEGRRSSFR